MFGRVSWELRPALGTGGPKASTSMSESVSNMLSILLVGSATL